MRTKKRLTILLLRFLSLIFIGGSLIYGITSGELSAMWFYGLGIFIITVSLIIE